MKALIVRQMVSEGAIAAVHGLKYPIHRLVIPERDNLTITPHKKNLYVWKDDEVRGDVVAEIDIPGSLVQDAETYLEIRLRLDERLRFGEDRKEYFQDQ